MFGSVACACPLSAGMAGVHVMETTFSWQEQREGRGGAFGEAPAFATANGTAIVPRQRNKIATAAAAVASPSPVNAGRVPQGLCTPGPTPSAAGSASDDDNRRREPNPPPVVTPAAVDAPSPPPPLLVRRREEQQQSPDTKAAVAAQASLSAVRQSFVRRRGVVVPKKASPPPPAAAGAADGSAGSAARLCSTPFVIRRRPASPSSAAATPAAIGPPAAALATARKIGESADGAGPGTPAAPGRVVTPTAGQEAQPAAGERRKKRKNPQEPASSRHVGTAYDGKGRKKSKKGAGLSATAGAGAGAEAGAGAGPGAESAAPAAPITVTFSAAGSLGMGLEADTTEEGTMCLAGKSPTSAAAPVPDGWRLSEVDGKSARRLGGGLDSAWRLLSAVS